MAHKEVKLPVGYIADLARLRVELVRWLIRNPGARPDFRFPSREVMVIGSMSVESADAFGILGNADARRCIAELDELTEHKATLFMLRVVLDVVPARTGAPS